MSAAGGGKRKTLEKWAFRGVCPSSFVFFDLFRSQSEASRAVLRAVAAENVVLAPTGKAFLSGHSLGAASTVASAIENLVGRELLYKSENGYMVYDRLFGIWLRRDMAS